MKKKDLPVAVEQQILWMLRSYEWMRGHYGGPDDRSYLGFQYRAINHALTEVGEDLPTEARRWIQEAVFQSCVKGRTFKFDRDNITGISYDDFMKKKAEFLAILAVKLGLIAPAREDGVEAARMAYTRI